MAVKKGTNKAEKLVGSVDNDEIYGYGGNDSLYGGKGNDYIEGGNGNDILHGEEGNDVFDGGSGNDMITDYKSGQDIFCVAKGSISKTIQSGKDVVFSIGKGSATLKNAFGSTIAIIDSRGEYTLSSSTINLGTKFSGTMDSRKYWSTIKTIDGKLATEKTNIIGNAKANVIYAGEAGGKISGYAGNDTLIGGKGKDTLVGGNGNDMFFYADGGGYDTVSDYEQGKDTVQIVNGTISKTSVSGKNIVFTVGKGSIALTKSAGLTVSIKDSRGNYKMSKNSIVLGANFSGTMNSSAYLATVKNINGSAATKSVNIYGNSQNNVLRAGKVGGTLRGRNGNDTLYGGAGKDIFQYDKGKDTIYNYQAGKDIVKFASTQLLAYRVSNNNVVLTLTNGGNITIVKGAGQTIRYIDNTGKTKTWTFASPTKKSIQKSASRADSTKSVIYSNQSASIFGSSSAQLASLVSTTGTKKLSTVVNMSTGLAPSTSMSGPITMANGSSAGILTGSKGARILPN